MLVSPTFFVLLRAERFETEHQQHITICPDFNRVAIVKKHNLLDIPVNSPLICSRFQLVCIGLYRIIPGCGKFGISLAYPVNMTTVNPNHGDRMRDIPRLAQFCKKAAFFLWCGFYGICHHCPSFRIISTMRRLPGALGGRWSAICTSLLNTLSLGGVAVS